MINSENNDLYDLDEALKSENLSINDYEEICKRLKNKGAKIIGGCCEITPKHIKYLNKLK